MPPWALITPLLSPLGVGKGGQYYFLRRGLQMGRAFVVCFIFLLNLHLASAQDSKKEPEKISSQQENLRERVNKFYGELKRNRWDKAAAYVIESGKPTFESQDRGKIYDYIVDSIKISPGEKSADVVISCKVIASFVGFLFIPRETRWKFEAGDWFYDPDDFPQPLYTRFAESQKAIAAKGKPEVRFDRESIDFGVAAKGKTVALRFPFSNQSGKEVKVEQIYLPKIENFMTDKTKVTGLKAGEKGEIVVDLNTSELLREVEATIFVEFQPVNEIFALKVKGKVFLEKDLVGYKPN